MAMLIACAPWAAKDQNPRRRIAAAAATGGITRCRAEELLANRIPCDKGPPAEKRHRGFERDRSSRHHLASSRFVETRHRVLLEQHRRDTAQRRGQHDSGPEL